MDRIIPFVTVILVILVLKLTWEMYIVMKVIKLNQLTLELHNLSFDLIAKRLAITLPATTQAPTTPSPTTTK